MRNAIIFTLFLSASTLFAQDGKKLLVTSKTGPKLQFSEVKIESEAADHFKSLCIKYIKQTESGSEITMNGKQYKYFSDKKSAVSHYYKVKTTSPKSVTYYVYSPDVRKPEILTFRVKNS